MTKLLPDAWKRLSEDLLVFRVMFFNLGVFIAALPIVAFATGTAAEVNDGAFYVLLGLLFAFGTYLLHVSVHGSKRLMTFSAWLVIGDLWAISAVLAILSLSVPITLAIRMWRTRHG